MEKNEIINRIKDKFAAFIKKWCDKSEKRIYLDIDKEILTEFSTLLFNDLKARFITASGLDARNNIEILYHFGFDQYGLIISLRLALPKPEVEVESIAPIIKGAEWIEREIHELLGVNFLNHPDLKRLLMSEDWPKCSFPLRRDYKESN